MPLKSVKVKLAERARAARQAYNERQVFFRLPAEIRNYIYGIILAQDHHIFQYRLFRQEKSTFDRFADSRNVWNRDGQWYSQSRIPALCSGCRRTRAEFMPMLLASATASLHVNVPNVRKTIFGNEQSFVDVFQDSAIAAIRHIEVRSDYECEGPTHRVGYAGPKKSTALDSLKVVIDRVAERIDVVAWTWKDAEKWRSECCRQTSRQAAERLVSSIKELGLQKRSRVLCRDDLLRLTQRYGGKVRDKRDTVVEPSSSMQLKNREGDGHSVNKSGIVAVVRDVTLRRRAKHVSAG